MGCDNKEKGPSASPLKIKTEQNVKKGPKEVEAKVVLLGDAGVGKSSIAMRFTKSTFSENYEVTIGGAYFQSQIDTSNNTLVKLYIWNTRYSRAERFRSMAYIYYRDAIAVILTYDITNPHTLDEGSRAT